MKIGQYVGLSHIFDIEIKVEPKQKLSAASMHFDSSLVSVVNKTMFPFKKMHKKSIQCRLDTLSLLFFQRSLSPDSNSVLF